MAVPALSAEDALAVRDVVRLDAILDLYLEAGLDFPSARMALARDSQRVTAEPVRLPLPAHWYARGRNQAQRPQDDWPKAVYRKGLPVAPALTAAPLRALLALQPAPDDEWESPQARSLRVRPASQPAPPQAQERVVCAPLEQPLLARPVRLALPQAQRESPGRSVLPRLAPHSLAEAPRVRQVSPAQPSRPLPSILFPLWQPLPPALLLRRRPESFCAPSRRRPREWSSSASSSP